MGFLASQLMWDLSIVLLIPAFLFSLYAQFKVSGAFNRYSSVPCRQGMSGYDAARRVLDANGLKNIQIEKVRGKLTDHYDPARKVIRLSDAVYSGRSIASVSVACHECGHAIQHATNFSPLMIRTAIVPVVSLASKLAIPLFFIGIVLSINGLETLGILFFSGSVIFQCVTLPVEFNASSRAIVQMENLGIIGQDERNGAKKVLGAAAMTYVAAMLMSLLQLVRLILISRSND